MDRRQDIISARNMMTPETHGLLPLDAIRRVACIGAGSVGKGWTALLLAKGYRLAIPEPGCSLADVDQFATAASPALERLGIASGPIDLNDIQWCDSLKQAIAGADLVFENGPEQVDIKQALIAQIDDLLPPDRLILSSSGGIRPSLIQARARHPGRVLVAHPFNPPHLVPLVEIVGGESTSPEAVLTARHC